MTPNTPLTSSKHSKPTPDSMTRVCPACQVPVPDASNDLVIDAHNEFRKWEGCKACLSRVQTLQHATGWSWDHTVGEIKSAYSTATPSAPHLNLPDSSLLAGLPATSSPFLLSQLLSALNAAASTGLPVAAPTSNAPPSARHSPRNEQQSSGHGVPRRASLKEPVSRESFNTDSGRRNADDDESAAVLDKCIMQLADARGWPEELNCRDIARALARAPVPWATRLHLLDAFATLCDNTVALVSLRLAAHKDGLHHAADADRFGPVAAAFLSPSGGGARPCWLPDARDNNNNNNNTHAAARGLAHDASLAHLLANLPGSRDAASAPPASFANVPPQSQLDLALSVASLLESQRGKLQNQAPLPGSNHVDAAGLTHLQSLLTSAVGSNRRSNESARDGVPSAGRKPAKGGASPDKRGGLESAFEAITANPQLPNWATMQSANMASHSMQSGGLDSDSPNALASAMHGIMQRLSTDEQQQHTSSTQSLQKGAWSESDGATPMPWGSDTNATSAGGGAWGAAGPPPALSCALQDIARMMAQSLPMDPQAFAAGIPQGQRGDADVGGQDLQAIVNLVQQLRGQQTGARNSPVSLGAGAFDDALQPALKRLRVERDNGGWDAQASAPRSAADAKRSGQQGKPREAALRDLIKSEGHAT